MEKILYSWDAVNPVRRERIEAGERAMEKIDRHETFHDWHAIGLSITEMQSEAMRQSFANKPVGKGYNAAWTMLAQRAPLLAKLDKATRSHAMWLAANWAVSELGPGVEEWHAKLPDHVRRLINHPATVHRRYDRDYPPAKDEPNPDRLGLDNDSDDDEDEDEERGFALGEGKGKGEGYTYGEWLDAIRRIWDEGETAWRDEFLDSEQALREAIPSPEAAAFDAAEAEADAAVERERALEVNAAARDTDKVKLSGEPSAETIGVAIAQAAEEIRAVAAGEKAAVPLTFPDDSDAEPLMSPAEFAQRLAAEETRLGKDVVATVKRAHRGGRYRIDWPVILDELAKQA
jgi:hypothetical protein